MTRWWKWKVRPWLVPGWAEAEANRMVADTAAKIDEAALIREYEQSLTGAADLAHDVATTLFDSETGRIERLEAKLSARTTALAFVIPFILTLLGAAIRDDDAWALLLGVLALVYAAFGYLMTTKADVTFAFHTTTPSDVVADVQSTNPKARMAARRLVHAIRNEVRGHVLNNAINAAQHAFIDTVVLLLAGVLVFGINRDTGTPQHNPTSGTPSPSATA